jgi:serine/threonine-protein kinase MRCK
MSIYSVTFRLADLRAQKQKLSRQTRDLEEQLEESKQKTDSIRQELRKVEKSKREVCLMWWDTMVM